MNRISTLLLAIGMVFSGGCSAATGQGLPVIPRTATAPAIDGVADEPAWAGGILIDDFSRHESLDKPTKLTSARVQFDDKNLYIAVVCHEKDVDKLRARAKAENHQVWQDDCVEVLIRASGPSAGPGSAPSASSAPVSTGNLLDYDQFIVNSIGTRGYYRSRLGQEVAWKPAFAAKASVGKGSWTAEFAIPWTDLGVAAPVAADMIELKICRAEQVSKPAQYIVWPAGSKYAGAEDYALVYFEKANLLANPSMAQDKSGSIPKWDFAEADRPAFKPQGDGSVVIDGHGRRVRAQQWMRLKPNTIYRLQATVQGGCATMLQASVGARPDRDIFTARANPSDSPQVASLTFSTDATGTAGIYVSAMESQAGARLRLSDLMLVQDQTYENVGEPIRLDVDAASPQKVTKVRVTDCRAVRGFIGSPTDGTTQSWGWDARFTEYNRHDGGQGIGYYYRDNDGLHVKLADKDGFDAVVVRGGVKADIYRDVPSYRSSEGGALIGRMIGKTRGSTRMLFDSPVKTDSVSFFDVGDGYISDVTFLRLGKGDSGMGEPSMLNVTGPTAGKDAPDRLARRFGPNDRTVLTIGAGKARRIEAPAGRFIHLASAELGQETPLAAMALEFTIPSTQAPVPFTVRVQDSADTRRELMGADFVANKAGKVRLVLDFPDQILPKASRIWVTLKFDVAVQLDDASIGLYVIDRAKAAPEALAYRKYLLRGLYSALSEPRPWNIWPTFDKAKEYLASDAQWAAPAQNIVDALDHCLYIGAQEDDDVRQYWEWIWRFPLKKAGKVPPFTPKLDLVEGAPRWACLARQAWLQARAVPQWWLDNRLVETGEFGGILSDDSDMYQNYADFVMFEDGQFAGRLRQAAADLAELAQKTTMIDGVNRVTMDPLHAYEEGLNQDALMAFWFYGDPVYLERCMASARSLEQLTVVTPSGHRHFRSQIIGADTRGDARTDTDGSAHPLMWHPTLELLHYNGNPLAEKYLRQWGDGWLEHMEKGKYATAVNVAQEKVTATSEEPFGGGYGGQGSAMQLLYLATGDKKYIAPFMDVLAAGETKTSPGVAADFYRSGLLDGIGASLDLLVRKDGICLAAAKGDKAKLCEDLVYSITELQRYGMMYTYVECFTDRVFLGGPLNRVTEVYTGGYATRNKYSRTHAVSYEGLGTDYAAFVISARPKHFKVLVYNFADKELKGTLRFWTLEHGKYKLTIGPDADQDDKADKIEREDTVEVARGAGVPVALPARKLVVIELTQVQQLDDIRKRPDLALSPLSSSRGNQTVEGVVHNIGSADAKSVEVALVDAGGKVIQRQMLGDLAAPNDLKPKRLAYKFEKLPADTTGLAVVVDVDGKVAEIYEGNNRVEVLRLPPTTQPSTQPARGALRQP